jgi:mannose-1-phosphate guanylyltransferase / mannose-6-phosphate isomerase
MPTKTTRRPWGTYSVLNQGKGFKVKLVRVNPHKRLSLQRHQLRSEHWVVVQGRAKVINGENMLYLDENESTYIPKRTLHRLENPRDRVLKIIEVQCGPSLVESDIERFDDDHGRAVQALPLHRGKE